ncbi:MAG: phosphate ABC transporter permease PstA, partial [Elusimicrobiota bacterium]|nr:phosphate ABC transporter permease PstA [Elusimicrobiota bacterium]
LLFLGSLIYFITVKGIGILSWSFLTQIPKISMTQGGIAPVILGTFYLTSGAVILALPLGVSCAIYLTEYAPKGILVELVRIGVNNLAGVPSVVFGLFGLIVFVKFFGFGVSIISGSSTLAIMILPNIISASCEALNSIPYSLREASLALGATRWQTIQKIILPNAIGGILTGLILSIGRAAGETAPIMFTAVTFYKKGFPKSIFSEVMALPYHIYALMTEGTYPEEHTKIAFGCALVLLILVLGISFIAIIIRNRQIRIHKF